MTSSNKKSMFARALATLLAVSLCGSSFAGTPLKRVKRNESGQAEAASESSNLMYWVIGGVTFIAAIVAGKVFFKTPAVDPAAGDAGQGGPVLVPNAGAGDAGPGNAGPVVPVVANAGQGNAAPQTPRRRARADSVGTRTQPHRAAHEGSPYSPSKKGQ